MSHDGVAAIVWGQNLLAGALLTLLSAFVVSIALPPLKRSWRAFAAIVSIGLLLVSFADAGQAGVHRWVQIGFFQLYAGTIALPILIIVVGDGLAAPTPYLAGRLVSPVACGVLSLLAVQPDAAQATAFAGALLTVLVLSRQPLAVTCSAVLVAVACIVWVWTRPDLLAPARHVEGMIGLAAERGTGWLVASLFALSVLPYPFLLARREDGQVIVASAALGVYFLLNVVVCLITTSPVPLLGFGLSPITGYFIALTWLLEARRRRPVVASATMSQLDHALR